MFQQETRSLMTNYLTYSAPDRIGSQIDQLSAITEVNRPFTRLVFSPEFDQARQWLKDQFVAAGLSCHVDAGGNLIGTRAGTGDEPRKKLMIGSHSDTVPAGGRFDGVAGVVAALEVVHYLNAQNRALPFDLEIVDYLGEELNIWGTSCLGSRHMAGLLTAEMLGRVDADGRVLGAEIARIGGSGNPSNGARQDANQIIGCLELHIEQATSLESQGCDIGVVTAIPGIFRYAITLTGAAGHSGTTPMAGRRDALVAAANIIQETSTLATQIASDDNQHFVATIGKIDVFPNGAAIIPGQAKLTLDLRAVSDSARIRFETAFKQILESTARTHRCETSFDVLAAAPVAPMDQELRQLLTAEALALDLPTIPISTGAGHDSAHLSRFAPAAMIFIPCKDGLSHCQDEFASNEAIAKGAAVLVRSVLALAEKYAEE